MAENTLIARAQEIIAKSENRISGHTALKQASLELYQTREQMADALATAESGSLNKLQKSLYNLPDDEQLSLFDVPATIAINTVSGVLFIGRDDATLDEVRQWLDEGDSWHSAQKLRFKRFRQKVKAELSEVDGDTRWSEARMKLNRPTK